MRSSRVGPTEEGDPRGGGGTLDGIVYRPGVDLRAVPVGATTTTTRG